MPASVILAHLGPSIPAYAESCLKQLHLWNPVDALDIYFVVDRAASGSEAEAFWTRLAADYSVKLAYTDALEPTEHHRMFTARYAGNTAFRDGYWKFVTERFFYIEEVMLAHKLDRVIAMEYDVLAYVRLSELVCLFDIYTPATIALVRDNETRAHPGFMYIPTANEASELNIFITHMLQSKMSDMELLHVYGEMYPERVSYLPVISHARNATKFIRKSGDGQHKMIAPHFLSSGYEVLGCLFDSAVVGQWVGGIDIRNYGAAVIPDDVELIHYENEGALYSIREMPFHWKKDGGLWRPYLDGSPLMTIHVHSKALECFLSDRPVAPVADYNPQKLYDSLPR